MYMYVYVHVYVCVCVYVCVSVCVCVCVNVYVYDHFCVNSYADAYDSAHIFFDPPSFPHFCLHVSLYA